MENAKKRLRMAERRMEIKGAELGEDLAQRPNELEEVFRDHGWDAVCEEYRQARDQVARAIAVISVTIDEAFLRYNRVINGRE